MRMDAQSRTRSAGFRGGRRNAGCQYVGAGGRHRCVPDNESPSRHVPRSSGNGERVLTYYPGVANLTDAMSVSVGADQTTVARIDFAIP